MPELLVATTNPHKLDEIAAILAPLGVRAIGLSDAPLPPSRAVPSGTGIPSGTGVPPVRTRLGEPCHPDPSGTGIPSGMGVPPVRTAADLPEPIEDSSTFAGNAAIKARYYAAATGRICIADDSGLEVAALAGAPGVHSARYAGVGAMRAERDAANNAKLLAALATTPGEARQAKFVCCMCLASPAGEILATSRGEFPGVIAHSPRGGNGFGYDPLLELPDGRTAAQLDPAEKNARSHRGAATRAIAPDALRILDNAMNPSSS